MIEVEYVYFVINKKKIKIQSIPNIVMKVHSLADNNKFCEMIDKFDDNVIYIVVSPYYVLWDQYMFIQNDDDLTFEEYYENNYDKIDYCIDIENVNILLLDDTEFICVDEIIVKDLDYIKTSLHDIYLNKLINDPCFNLFYNNDMICQIKNIYNAKITNYSESKIKKVPKEFDIKSYSFLNPDIKNRADLLNHYIEKNDKFSIDNIPKDFDDGMFRILYPELKLNNRYDTILYYETIGHETHKKYKFDNIPKNFNYYAFKLYNKNLRHLSKKDTYLYIEKLENTNNIKCTFDNVPYDFDPWIYKRVNKDLNKINMSEYELYAHYEMCGFYDERKYK